MARDKGYGSGKPRSAANSAARRDRSASANLRKQNIQKVASKPFQKARVASVGKQNAAGLNIGGKEYLESGFMPLAAAVRVAQTLANANKGAKAAAVMQRSAIAEAGRAASRQWAATRAMKGSGKKFQASAAKSWHMRFIGESLKAASKPKVASLAVRPTIGKNLSLANRANTQVKEQQAALRAAQTAAKQGRPGSLAELERLQSVVSSFKTRGVGARGSGFNNAKRGGR